MYLTFKSQLSLCRITTIRIAALVWRHPVVRNGIIRIIVFQQTHLKKTSYNDLIFNNFVDSTLFVEVIVPIIKKLKYYQLPSNLTHELSVALRALGKKLFYWYSYVGKLYNFDPSKIISCIDKVQWTYYGCIDYERTFEVIRTTDTKLSKWDLFVMASDLCLPKHLHRYWQAAPADIHSIHFCGFVDYWQSVHDGVVEEFESKLNLYATSPDNFEDPHSKPVYELYVYREIVRFDDPPPDRISVDLFMLATAISKVHCAAVKYFWNKLNNEDKKKYLVPLAELHLQHFIPLQRDEYVHICIFLLNLMSSQDLILLHREDPDSVKNALIVPFVAWPSMCLFMTILRKFWTACEETNYTQIIVVELIANIKLSLKNHRVELNSVQKKNLISYIWTTVPKRLKLLCSIQSYDLFIHSLMCDIDVDLVELVINDPDLAHVRNNLIKKLSRTCRDCHISMNVFKNL